jgi:accessory gene regulator protein AgrB
MNTKLEMTIISILVVIFAILSAWVSIKIRANEVGVWAYFMTGNLTLMTWVWISKYSKVNLLFASFLCDILVAITWAVVLFYFGDKLTVNQMIGSTIALAGLVVFNL